MDILPQPKNMSTIGREIEGENKKLSDLLVEKNILIKDLEGYETDGYEYFKTNILPNEKIRLALLRMKIPSEEKVLHDRIQGQFNEVELLERNQKQIVMLIEICNRKMSDGSKKINKLEKQLKRQTKRR